MHVKTEVSTQMKLVGSTGFFTLFIIHWYNNETQKLFSVTIHKGERINCNMLKIKFKFCIMFNL
jgi:hypothetical protein